MSTVILLFLLSTLLLGGAAALAVAAVHRPLLARIAGWTPARRASLLHALLVAPLAVGLLQTLLGLVPGALSRVWPTLDHCLEHGGVGHPHLCVTHASALAEPTLAVVLVVGGLAWITFSTAAVLRDWLRSERVTRALFAAGAYDDALRATLLPTDSPLAATDLRGRVLVSDGLLRSLAPIHRTAVLRHEHAHARRRDPLRLLVTKLLSGLQLPAVRRRLIAELELACEQACDEEAAASGPGRVAMAEALLAVERLVGARVAVHRPSTAGFGGTTVVPRVESLLAPPGRGAPHPGVRGAGLSAAAFVFASEPLHHAVEVIAGMLGA